MKSVLISLGQIPAKLDSVKYIGNKFSGGLMMDLAKKMSPNYKITIVKWIDKLWGTTNERPETTTSHGGPEISLSRKENVCGDSEKTIGYPRYLRPEAE